MTIHSITPNEILQVTSARTLFHGTDAENKEWYHALAKKFHPDVAKIDVALANKVFIKLKKLYESLSDKPSDSFVVVGWESNSAFPFKIIHNFSFDLGEVYVGKENVMYGINKNFRALVENYQRNIKNVKYPTSDIEKIYNLYIPKILAVSESAQKYFIHIQTPAGLVFLSDIVKHYQFKIPHAHVTWIMSRLYDLNCFMEYNKLCFNGWLMDNLMVNPQDHSVFLAGGWWYSSGLTERITSIPQPLYNIMTFKEKTDKISSLRLNLGAIREIGCSLLDTKNPSEVLFNKDIPIALREWVTNSTAQTSSIKEKTGWGEVIVKAYGKRTFTVMDISQEKLYQS